MIVPFGTWHLRNSYVKDSHGRGLARTCVGDEYCSLCRSAPECGHKLRVPAAAGVCRAARRDFARGIWQTSFLSRSSTIPMTKSNRVLFEWLLAVSG